MEGGREKEKNTKKIFSVCIVTMKRAILYVCLLWNFVCKDICVGGKRERKRERARFYILLRKEKDGGGQSEEEARLSLSLFLSLHYVFSFSIASVSPLPKLRKNDMLREEKNV